MPEIFSRRGPLSSGVIMCMYGNFTFRLLTVYVSTHSPCVSTLSSSVYRLSHIVCIKSLTQCINSLALCVLTLKLYQLALTVHKYQLTHPIYVISLTRCINSLTICVSTPPSPSVSNLSPCVSPLSITSVIHLSHLDNSSPFSLSIQVVYKLTYLPPPPPPPLTTYYVLRLKQSL
jgi:hypothetical protein